MKNRFGQIADYMSNKFTTKEVIAKSKALLNRQSMGMAGKDHSGQSDKLAKSESQKKAVDADTWSEEQQKSLEIALKTFPKTLPPKERWTKISESVEGKTPKECLTRFKYIVSLLKKK